MITGFAAGGVVGLVPALAAMLGANVGTTLIVQLLSFDLTSLAPILILAGVWMFRRYPPGRTRDLGRVFIGLGLLLLSLHQLVQLFEPFQSAPMLGMVLEALSTQPVVAVLLSAIFTWARTPAWPWWCWSCRWPAITWWRRTWPSRWCWAPTWAPPSIP